MKTLICIVVLIAVAVMAVPAFAGDIVAMPTGNMMAPRTAELNYIRWQDSFPGGQDANIYEGFVGITDWLEVDAIHVDPTGASDARTEGNIYVRAIKETATHPSLILGATNFTASKWIDGKEEASFFALGAYNIHVPAGAPSFNDPLVRLHVAWGDKFHGDTWFGGFQMRFTPWLGAAAFSYQGDPSYVGVLNVIKNVELRGGWKSGTPFYSAGYDFKF